MNWSEVESAAAPFVQAIHEQSMRTSLLLFAFLGCVLIFSYVFLKKFPIRAPFRWIVALAALSALVLLRAGGLRKPEVSVLIGIVEKVEEDKVSGTWKVVLHGREYVLQNGQAAQVRERSMAPALPQVARELKSGSEETLILIRGQAVGIRKEGRSKIFLSPSTSGQK